jgi:hypothetical protein
MPVMLGDANARHPVISRTSWFDGSSLPKWTCSAISAAFIARLIKGCRVDDRAGFVERHKNLSTFNALTSILAGKAPFLAGFSAATGEPNAQTEDQIGRQKALQGDCHR